MGDIIYYIFDRTKHYCKVRRITNEVTGNPYVWGFWTSNLKKIDEQLGTQGFNPLIGTKHYLHIGKVTKWREKLQ